MLFTSPGYLWAASSEEVPSNMQNMQIQIIMCILRVDRKTIASQMVVFPNT